MQALDEQVITIERALGERMVKHALFIVRRWLNELGEMTEYEDRYRVIYDQYDRYFDEWVQTNGANDDQVLDQMTTQAYRLVDDVYASLRIKRGLSPTMHGFNGQNPQSVMHYFSHCVQFESADIEWLQTVMNDSSSTAIGLVALTALCRNLRECFSEQAMLVLIEGINSSNMMIAEQCTANAIMLLAHYDVRIDFFPELQTAFLDVIDGKPVFETLCAVIKSVQMSLSDLIESGALDKDNIPPELQNLLDETGMKGIFSETDSQAISMPASEKEYIANIAQMMPDTWVYSVLVGEDEDRKQKMQLVYLYIGNMDMMWDDADRVEQILHHKFRTKHNATAKDYINYGHCLMLKGDRMMAFESYREARRLCKTAKAFYTLFRPGRRQLVDRGVPVEQVYLIEDQLFSI